MTPDAPGSPDAERPPARPAPPPPPPGSSQGRRPAPPPPPSTARRTPVPGRGPQPRPGAPMPPVASTITSAPGAPPAAPPAAGPTSPPRTGPPATGPASPPTTARPPASPPAGAPGPAAAPPARYAPAPGVPAGRPAGPAGSNGRHGAPAIGTLPRRASAEPDRPDGDAVSTASQLVRISIDTGGDGGTLDVAVSDGTTVAALLTTALELVPTSVREAGVAHGGWVLHRPRGSRLDGAATLASLGIPEGAVLSLVGVYDEPRPAAFDDVADIVGEASSRQVSPWSARAGRRISLAAACVAASVVLLPGLFAGPPWTVTTGAYGALAVLLVVAAGLVSRGVGDGPVAATLAVFATASGALAGATALAGHRPVLAFRATEYLLGTGVAVLVASLCVLVVASRLVPLYALIVAATVGVIATGVGSIWQVHRVGMAGLGLILALVLTPLIPIAAFRLARFRMPPLPATAEDVVADVADLDDVAITRQTEAAVDYVTGLVTGTALAAAVAMLALCLSPHNPAALGLVAVASVGLMLRSRLFTGTVQRLPMLLAGFVGLTAAALNLLAQHDHRDGLLVVAAPALVLLVVGVAVAGRTRPVTPVATRTAEILEVLLGIAAIPLTVTVVGLLGLIHGLGG